MEYHDYTLYNGLHLMYQGNLIGLVGLTIGLIVLFIPVIGLLAGLFLILIALVGAIMSIVASFRLRRMHSDYTNALILLIAGFFCHLLSKYGPGGISDLAEIVGWVCSIAEAYFFIRATNSFLSLAGREDLVERGWKVFKVQVAGCVIAAVVEVLALLAAEDVSLLLALALAAGVVAIVMAAFFLQYLKESAEALRPTSLL